ncbi:MAG: type II toxin-antitoxin system VapC family toxin [Candidatus Methanomethyliaceae archaeon]
MGETLRKFLAKHRILGVDTSVLIYHFADVPPYSDFTEGLFSAVARGEAELVIPALCATEFLVKPWEEGEERAGGAASPFGDPGRPGFGSGEGSGRHGPAHKQPEDGQGSRGAGSFCVGRPPPCTAPKRVTFWTTVHDLLSI